MVAAFALLALVLLAPARALAGDAGVARTLARRVQADLLYAGRTAVADVKTVATAPLHAGQIGWPTTKQLLTAAAVLGSIGATMAVDQTIRARARDIGTHDGRLLETTGGAVSVGSIGVLYLAGLATGNDTWRHGAMTGVESYGLTTLLVAGAQSAFGRQRPNAGKGAYRFFDGGTSFVSSATAPAFAAAESVSAAVGHDWRVTLPTYAAATSVGAGRLAQDAHWASDVVGAAWLAVGTTQALRALHRTRRQKQQAPSSSWDIARLPGNGIGLQLHVHF